MTKIKIIFMILILFVLALCNIATSQTWEQTNGPNESKILSLAVNSSGDVYAGTKGEGIYLSTDNGNSWDDMSDELANKYVNIITIHSSGDIFIGTRDGIYRSTDEGDSWIENGLKNISVYGIVFKSIDTIFAGTYYGAYRSFDNGNNWTQINNGVPADHPADVIAINSTGIIYIGTPKGVFKSTNNGDNWTDIDKGAMNYNVTAIAINSSDDIFVGRYFDGISRSINNGETWTNIDNGPIDKIVFDFAVSSSGTIFAGVYDGGVFQSTDNGENWVEVNEGLSNSFILSLAISSDDKVYAGTSGGGVFRLDYSPTEIYVENNSNIIPSDYSILQNYPNPFNPATNISFDLPRKSYVNLSVYNLLGQKVETLINKEMEAGRYNAIWDGIEMASGIYFYRIETDDFVETKKMLLLK